MTYDYDKMKPYMEEKDYQKVKENVMTSTKERLTFNDFGKGFVCFDSWLMLCYIDRLEEEGIIKAVKKEGFRQYWEYERILNTDTVVDEMKKITNHQVIKQIQKIIK